MAQFLKKTIFAVAGSGKTTQLVNMLDGNQRFCFLPTRKIIVKIYVLWLKINLVIFLKIYQYLLTFLFYFLFVFAHS